LLVALHAMEVDGRLTVAGRRMAQFPVHPRLSRMLIEASRRGCVERAALWAALISERPIVMGEVPADRRAPVEGDPRSDLLVMEHLFGAAENADFQPRACDMLRVNGQACREVARTRSQLLRIILEDRTVEPRTADDTPVIPLRPSAPSNPTVELLKCLLTAFPDHVAFRPDESRLDCRMIGRRRVVLDKSSVACHRGLLLAIEVRETGAGDGVKTALSIVSEIEPAWLEEIHRDRIAIRDEPRWNADMQAVEQVEEHLFDGLAYHRKARQQVDPDRAGEILVDEIARKNLRLEHWDEKVEQWILRTRLVAGWFPERGLIRYDDDETRLVLHEIVAGAVRFSQVKDRPCLPAVMNALSYDDQRFVEQMAPQSIKMPRAKGGDIKIEYFPDGPPRGRAKIQELYDLQQTPRIAAGRINIVLEILGPNYRPVQVTDDLSSFWTNQYPILRKELSRKYPRHEWR
jgi:ATP-dependent helicase HrpB